LNGLLLGGDQIDGDPKTSVIGIDPRTGKILWRLPPRAGLVRFPVFDRHSVYAFTDRQHLQVFDARTGRLHWRVRVPEGPITIADSVVVSSDGRISAFSLRGRHQWSAAVPRGIGEPESVPEPAGLSQRLVLAPIEGSSGCTEHD
jgi:outer membrane protein assembly factor BamB